MRLWNFHNNALRFRPARTVTPGQGTGASALQTGFHPASYGNGADNHQGYGFPSVPSIFPADASGVANSGNPPTFAPNPPPPNTSGKLGGRDYLIIGPDPRVHG